MREVILFTCEHGGNRVPPRYRWLFAGQDRVLSSHRGWDPGALAVARRLAASLDAPLVASEITRLLVELNRSPHHPHLWSRISRRLDRAERARVRERYYDPYRQEVEGWIGREIDRDRRVIHVSVHSFTPVLNGRPRHTDVGLLYDPARPDERTRCATWKAVLGESAPALRVRRNFPYRGVADGFIPALRRMYGPSRYVGIELEMSQARLRGSRASIDAFTSVIVDSARRVLTGRPVC